MTGLRVNYNYRGLGFMGFSDAISILLIGGLGDYCGRFFKKKLIKVCWI